MTNAKGVVFALGALGEAGNAAVRAQLGHASTASGEDLVGIGLVAYVPDQAVIWRIENVMQGDG